MAGTTFENDEAEGRFSRDRLHVVREFLPKLKRVVRQVPFAEDLLAAYYVALDRETPHRVRAVIFAALAYFILPFDGVPDFLVGIGFTDDAAVLFAAYRLISGAMKDRHREAARRWLQDLDVNGTAG